MLQVRAWSLRALQQLILLTLAGSLYFAMRDCVGFKFSVKRRPRLADLPSATKSELVISTTAWQQ